jgi:hypothetical protein
MSGRSRSNSDGKPETTRKHQISNGGGSDPHWGADGKELFYLPPDRRTLMSTEITTRPDFQSSKARPVFQFPATVHNFAVTADEKRFLADVDAGQSGPAQFTVVLNWQAALKK